MPTRPPRPPAQPRLPRPAPGAWLIQCVDLHTEGEPLRVILSGFPVPQGRTILERRRDARANFDDLRRALMWEPRGHADMYGCMVVPAERDDSDFGVLFMHNDGFSTMCGHGVLAMARAAVETGLVPASEPETRIAMDTPAGQVHAVVTVEDGRPVSTRFRNVASWVAALDATAPVPGFGTVRYDLAFGGAFYAYVDAESLGLRLDPRDVPALVEAGRAVKASVQQRNPPAHPEDPDLGFLYGVVFTGPARRKGNHSRHVCVFADGEVDRSPTGTAVSGRLALLHARGALAPEDRPVIESVIGTRFTCRVVEETEFHGHPAVVPEVEGRCWITGWSTFHLDPEDPLRNGFLLR